MTALVVFDTCTRSQYYADVHELLALPSGTILRYTYEEKYFSVDAMAYLRQLREADCPIDVVLFYGQFEDYAKGGDDPTGRMLDPASSLLIPTRYAHLRNVAFEDRVGGGGNSRTVVYFHMELAGFPDPDSPAIRPLLDMLASKRELPFEKWVALAPNEADLTAFRREDVQLWGKVVDRLAAPPSQFHGDVFWRIDHLERVGSRKAVIYPQPRDTNRFGDKEYASDYALDALTRYRLSLSSIVPDADGKDLPPGSAVTIRAEDAEPLILPQPRQEFRRNASTLLPIGVKAVTDVNPRYMTLSIRTEIPDHNSPYTPGSVANITVVSRLSGYRVTLTLLIVAIGAVFAAVAAEKYKSGEVGWGAFCTVAGLFCALVAGMFFFGKVKFGGGGQD